MAVSPWRCAGARFFPALMGAVVLACSDSTTVRCNTPLSSGCWEFLGPDDEWVTAVAQNEWGLFIGTREGGVLRLDGSQWIRVGLDNPIINALLFVAGNPRRLLAAVEPKGSDTTRAVVYSTEDRGRTWVPWDAGLAEQGGYRGVAVSLAADPSNADRLYMGQAFAVMRTTDAGRTWNYVFANQSAIGLGVNAIVVHPVNTRRVWAGARDPFLTAVVLTSQDGGDTWTRHNPLPGVENGVFSVALDASDANRAWAAMDGAAMETVDGGDTWTASLSTVDPGRVTALVFVGDTLYARSEESGSVQAGVPQLRTRLYRTIDRGLSWDTLATPRELLGGSPLEIDSAGRLLVGTRGGLWRLTRSGG